MIVDLKNISFLMDNSSLSSFLLEPDLLNVVDVNSGSFTLFFSLDTFNELAKGGNQQKVISRIKAMLPLLTSFPPKLFISRGLRTVLKKELRNSGNLKNLLFLINSPNWEPFVDVLSGDPARLSQALSTHRGLMLEKNSITNSLVDADKFLRGNATPQSASLVRSRIENFDQNYEFQNLLFDHRNVGLSKSVFRKIIKTTIDTKFSTYRYYFYLIQIRLLGDQLFDFNGLEDPLRFLQKIKSGNWYDLAIIAQSYSYSYFVTEDKDQRDFCNFLRHLGISKCRAIDRDEMKKIIGASGKTNI